MGGKKSKMTAKDEEKRSAREKTKSRTIDRRMQDDQSKHDRYLRFLLLGAGESGKSTVFKQIVQLYGEGFGPGERAEYNDRIRENVLTSMKELINQHAIQVYDGNLDEEEVKMTEKLDEAANFIVNNPIGTAADSFTKEHADAVSKLWASPQIKAVWDLRANFQVPDSVQHFFDRVYEISKPDYLPTYDDILRVRSRTTGIVESEFTIDQSVFKIMDVGGQRSERKKWLNCFDNITAVMFVAALDGYNMNLFEDNATNRMREAIDLFSDTCNGRWFKNSAMILFLNKRDLFQEKLKTVPLTVCFPDFDGGDDYDAAVQYVTNQFLAVNKHPDSRKIYVHVTVAMDEHLVRFTMGAVKNIVLDMSIKEIGME